MSRVFVSGLATCTAAPRRLITLCRQEHATRTAARRAALAWTNVLPGEARLYGIAGRRLFVARRPAAE